MLNRRLRRRSGDLVRALDLPDPFDIEELCERVGQQRGRPMQLLPIEMAADTPCGVWIGTRTNDYVFYEARTTPLHQRHIIAHEIGHLLHNHAATPTLDDELARLLLPNLDPGLVQRVLGRTRYSAKEEREAETFASVVMQVSTRRRQMTAGVEVAATDPVAAELDRFSSLLDAARLWRE